MRFPITKARINLCQLARREGDRVTIPVADSGSLYNLQLTVGGPERVTVPAGDTTAWSLKGFITDTGGQPVWNNIAGWISSDARRLPVKMQADLPVGSFVLALGEVRSSGEDARGVGRQQAQKDLVRAQAEPIGGE